MENNHQSILQTDLEAALDRDPALWRMLDGKRIFLTGGTGFFGAWLLETYLAARERRNLVGEMLVLSRDPESFIKRHPHLGSHPALTFLKGDIRSFPFPRGPFDCMVHAAVEYGSPLETLEGNLQGSLRVLEFARLAGIKRLLFTSSGAVYGPRNDLAAMRTDEDAFVGSPWLVGGRAYGEMKRVTEMLGCLRAEEDGFSFLIARGFAFLGPYLSLEGGSAAGNFIGDALAGRPIRVRSDGSALRSYLYGCDLAVWLWTILMRGQHGRPYNVGSEEAITIGDLAMRVRNLLNPALPVEFAKDSLPGHPPDIYVPSTARVRRELNLDAWTGLDAMILRTAQWNAPLGSAPPVPTHD